jgi:hypothetical protein
VWQSLMVLVERKQSQLLQDNAAVNCITVQHKKVSFPSIFMGLSLC